VGNVLALYNSEYSFIEYFRESSHTQNNIKYSHSCRYCGSIFRVCYLPANPETLQVPSCNSFPITTMLYGSSYRLFSPINVCYLCIMNDDKLSNKDIIFETLPIPLSVLPTALECETGWEGGLFTRHFIFHGK